MNIYQRVAQHALLTPNKIAVTYQKQTLTYLQLIEKVDNLSSNLFRLGFHQQSKVALFCGNNIEFVLTLLAIAKLGAAVAPLPLTLKGQALTNALKGIGCDRVIAWSTVGKQILSKQLIEKSCLVSLDKQVTDEVLFSDLLSASSTEQLPIVDCDNDYILTLTSGSTGNPKPIVFSQTTKINRAFQATINYYQLTADDVVLVATPLYHSLAQRSLLMPLMLGACVVILPKFTINGWLHALTEHKVSFLFAVSSQLTALLPELENNHGFRALKCLVSSSATLAKEDKAKLLNKLSCHFHECYGASEVGVVTDFDITALNQPVASVGKPLPFVDVKICNTQREILKEGEIGEIACKTSTAFKGYYGLAEQTAASFDQQGYFYTGDLGYLDAQGYLYFVGRTKEVIKSGGINVYPNDVEKVMSRVEGIKECAAIAMEDNQFGEVIWLCYVLESHVNEFDEKKLARQAMAELIDYQLPRKYLHFEQFPKSALGKILKPEIKKQLQAMSNTNGYK